MSHNQTARRRNDRPKAGQEYHPILAFFIIVLLVSVCVSVGLYVAYRGEKSKAEALEITQSKMTTTKRPTVTPLGPSYTQSSEDTIFWYCFQDPDTGIWYLCTDHGGCTPRLLDTYGNVMGAGDIG